jgi:hypothetical protein
MSLEFSTKALKGSPPSPSWQCLKGLRLLTTEENPQFR